MAEANGDQPADTARNRMGLHLGDLSSMVTTSMATASMWPRGWKAKHQQVALDLAHRP